MKSLCAIALIALFASNSYAVAQELYVFLPTDVRAKALENELVKSCPKLKITVFGRVKDFIAQVKNDQPAGILTLLPTIEHNAGYSVILQGTKDGEGKEPYIFVSVDKPIDVSKLSELKIGVVDILGRKPMKEFVTSLFGKDVAIKRVTKREDLLSLLSFKSVDAIFVSEELHRDLSKKSQLNLVTTPVDVKIGLASTAFNANTQMNEIVNCVNGFGSEINALLGVDQWKKS